MVCVMTRFGEQDPECFSSPSSLITRHDKCWRPSVWAARGLELYGMKRPAFFDGSTVLKSDISRNVKAMAGRGRRRQRKGQAQPESLLTDSANQQSNVQPLCLGDCQFRSASWSWHLTISPRRPALARTVLPGFPTMQPQIASCREVAARGNRFRYLHLSV